MKANDSQVGGSHYRAMGDKIQHWDLTTMYQWDPFQYQITKYVMRWKDKHATHTERLQDLKKARHFIDKYIEEAEKWDPRGADALKGPGPGEVIHLSPGDHINHEALHPSDPGFIEINTDWQCEGWYGDNTNLYRCKHCRNLFRTTDVWAAAQLHGECPKSRGYVKQD